MKIIIVLVFVLVSGFCFGQNDYLNEDGTMSDKSKREYLLIHFNENKNENTQYSIEDKYFVIISKYDCGNKKYGSEEMQKRALSYSFQQLLNQISILKLTGYKIFSDVNFEGIIFKTNTICMTETRRYNFKFNLSELNNFPEYMDFDELYNYVVVQNKNKNIIYVKNKN